MAAAALLRRNPSALFSTLAAVSTPKPKPKPKPPSNPIAALKSAIRAESDPDRILSLFESSVHLPRFHCDRPLYHLSVHRLARHRRPDLVDRLLQSQLSSPSAPKSEGFHIRILSLYSLAGMLDHALRTFDRMPSRTEKSLSALLTAFLDRRQFDRVRELFHSASASYGIAPGVVSYNVLIRALCEDGDVAAARKLLDEMREKSLVPNIISYNTLLSGFLKKGDEEGFETVLKEMTSKGFELNVVTYNYRIKMLCGKKESFKGEELLDVMVEKGVLPNLTTFNALIEGFCKEGDVGSAVRVFKRMRVMKRVYGKDGASPNSETYVVLVRSLVEKGEFGVALEICRECLVRRFAPPFEVMKGLLNGLVRESKAEGAKDIIEKMEEIVKGDAIGAWEKLKSEVSLQGTT